jgi:hypothetical protein
VTFDPGDAQPATTKANNRIKRTDVILNIHFLLSKIHLILIKRGLRKECRKKRLKSEYLNPLEAFTLNPSGKPIS